MHENLVLIGAGSAMFTRGLIADVIRHGWEGGIGLVDTDPAALRVAERLAQKMLAASGAPLRLRAATDRRDLLPGATAVICTIGVGGRRAWEQDVLVPRRFGIFQPVGDSVMPGGTSRALRMIPAMVGIAADMLDLCPSALFFNYGNPMSPVCRAVHRATGACMVGLCHGVFDVGRHLAGLLGVAPDDLRYTALGINHLTWFTEVRAGGRDMIPRLAAIAREKVAGLDHAQPNPHPADGASADRSAPFGCGEDPFTWELVNLFGAFPAVMDRHVTEFFPHLFAGPGSYYGRTLGVDAFSFEGTIAWGDRIYAEMQELAESPEPLPAKYFERIGGEHEQVTEIVESIRNDRGTVYSANLPNRGQIPNLPADAVVECPAVADAGGMRPLLQPPLPAGIAGTLATRLQWVETVVEAALTASRKTFIQALLLDGAVASVAQAAQLADALLAVQQAHLPDWRQA
ncbi:MAG: Alpha-glucosidase [Lentisphaerae bacterium ADurb.BinA184]|nr:MAG: Alpha-glucosidase [Lentisphaerae bacterium ADurb.BinA184]